MSLFSGIGDILKQYSGGTQPTQDSSADVQQHFDQVAQAVPQSSLASGLAAAFRSGQTPSFGEMAAQLFSRGNGQQQASVLSTLLGSVGPSVVSGYVANHPGSPLASLLQSGQTSVTPDQAASVDPQEVQALAQHAEQHNPSVIDELSQVYAQHPALVKTLGAGALAIAMRTIAQHHS